MQRRSRFGYRWSAALLMAPFLAACGTVPDAPRPFAHLEATPRAIRTTHGVRLTLRSPSGFRLAGPTHRTAEFDGHPYEVSLAAFLGSDEAVMVHAERVADRSGASNYQNLPAADWPGAGFRRRGYCVAVTPEMVAAEHDLNWLRGHGWDPAGNVAAVQYLATTPDFNEEVVVSLLVRNVDCGDPDSVERATAALRARVEVEAAGVETAPSPDRPTGR